MKYFFLFPDTREQFPRVIYDQPKGGEEIASLHDVPKMPTFEVKKELQTLESSLPPKERMLAFLETFDLGQIKQIAESTMDENRINGKVDTSQNKVYQNYLYGPKDGIRSNLQEKKMSNEDFKDLIKEAINQNDYLSILSFIEARFEAPL